MLPDLRPTPWRTCRVLANHRRIEIMRHLFTNNPNCVSDVARCIDLPENTATQYLRLLNSRGLLCARRAGAFVWYTPEANPQVENSAEFLTALRLALVRNELSTDEVFFYLTAFTSERRIRIIRHLHKQPCGASALGLQLHIPQPSLSRNVTKLVARGYVRYDRASRVYCCVPQQKQLPQDLMEIILRA